MTINCNGKLIDLSSPKIMGILNLTPDSFYDGKRYNNNQSIISQVEKMIMEGADFIDIGAYSSRPNADFVSEKDEFDRINIVFDEIIEKFPNILISVDSFRPKIADFFLSKGACIINDISGFEDKEMIDIVLKHNAPYILMHKKGDFKSMQNNPNYENIVKEVYQYLDMKMSILYENGVNDVIIDLGFGFGKSLDHNYELIKNMDFFKLLKTPILTGISRKSMIYNLLNINPINALNGSSIMNFYALSKGTNILRVHDVKEAKECVRIFEKLFN